MMMMMMMTTTTMMVLLEFFFFTCQTHIHLSFRHDPWSVFVMSRNNIFKSVMRFFIFAVETIFLLFAIISIVIMLMLTLLMPTIVIIDTIVVSVCSAATVVTLLLVCQSHKEEPFCSFLLYFQAQFSKFVGCNVHKQALLMLVFVYFIDLIYLRFFAMVWRVFIKIKCFFRCFQFVRNKNIYEVMWYYI